tara:strand:- start:32 stop:319 length:288 start_codon:yes stop_codon:yes gene_type:complete
MRMQPPECANDILKIRSSRNRSILLLIYPFRFFSVNKKYRFVGDAFGKHCGGKHLRRTFLSLMEGKIVLRAMILGHEPVAGTLKRCDLASSESGS